MGARKRYIWLGFGESIVGDSHRKRGTKCQDAIDWLVGKNWAVMAIADGHGDKKCIHSDVGAKIAVDVAIETLFNFHETIEETKKTVFIEHIAEHYLSKLLVQSWREKVRKAHRHIENSEFSREEEIYELYGSTLVSALVVGNTGLFTQIGDGEILVVRSDGSVSKPLSDDLLLGNYTNSLSLPDAVGKFRIGITRFDAGEPALVLLCSDGISNSFVNDDNFLELGSDYLELLENEGFEYVAKNLPKWSKEIGHKGSGDDVSLGILWRCIPKIKHKTRKEEVRNADVEKRGSFGDDICTRKYRGSRTVGNGHSR